MASAKIEEAEPHVVRIKVQFGGDETVYEVPIKSELGEVEGDSYELGFSIEVGGAEKFKTKSPALVVPPMRPLRLVARYGQHMADKGVIDDTQYDQPIAYRHVALGTATTEDATAKLKILAKGYTDAHGYLLDRDPDEKGDEPPRPLIVRGGRSLYIVDDSEPIKGEGATQIPIAACDPVVGDDGPDLIVFRTQVIHPMSLRIAERPTSSDRKFGEAKTEGPKLPALSSLFSFGGRTKDGARE